MEVGLPSAFALSRPSQKWRLLDTFSEWPSLTGQPADSLVHFRACGNVAKSLAAETNSFIP